MNLTQQPESSRPAPWDPAVSASAGSGSVDSAPLCRVIDLGRRNYADALAIQHELVDRRKRGEIADTLLFVEHPHVVTMGRNGGRTGAAGRSENLLASPELLERAGIQFFPSDRGGDVTYHGPGQIVGYPIFDLREWKRDVVAYVRGIEEVVIRALNRFGIQADREDGATGVWVGQGTNRAKICAIGIHVSRWVTSHGFALNLDTDLNYFRYIVPCGLTRPVTSMRALGSTAGRPEVTAALGDAFGEVFSRRMTPAELENRAATPAQSASPKRG